MPQILYCRPTDGHSKTIYFLRCSECRDRTLPVQLRNEWGYKYWVTTDAGSVDMLITLHGTCDSRECAAKTAIENQNGEMGGGISPIMYFGYL